MPAYVSKHKEKAPDRDKLDNYITLPHNIEAGLKLAHQLYPKAKTILDIGAGDGRWGHQAEKFWPKAEISGVEITERLPPIFPNGAYTHWYGGTDFLTWTAPRKYNLIIGNPFFTKINQTIPHALGMLKANGMMILLLKTLISHGQRRYKGIWVTHPPNIKYTITERVNFEGRGDQGMYDFCFMCWQKDRWGNLTGQPQKWTEEIITCLTN